MSRLRRSALLHGSGFLSVSVAAITLGNGDLADDINLRRIHDALGGLAQIVTSLLLGLLVFPSRLVSVAGVGFALAGLVAFVARPVVVAACLAPFRVPMREIVYVGWVGSRERFDVVFFVVVAGSFLPGATVPWFTRKIGLIADVKAPARSSDPAPAT